MTVRFRDTHRRRRRKAHELLADLWARHGDDVGSMVRTMATSPAVLAGYLDLSRAMKRSKLPREIAERISLAIQQRLGCAMCLAAHTAEAEAAGVPADEIAAAREGGSNDPRINAIVELAVRAHEAPSSIDSATVDAVRGHGFSDTQILDVVGLVSLNILTGTFNLVAGLEPASRPPPTPSQSRPQRSGEHHEHHHHIHRHRHDVRPLRRLGHQRGVQDRQRHRCRRRPADRCRHRHVRRSVDAEAFARRGRRSRFEVAT
jgi:AhpD family alkylhydroperoxidase